MNAKIAIVMIAIVGIGLYALPSTVALFSGQHSFVNIDASGNQIDCVKCHGDVGAELSGTADTPHDQFTCDMCHRIEAGQASGDSIVYTQDYVNGTGSPLLKRTIVVSQMDHDLERIPDTIPNNGTIVPRPGTGAFLAFASSKSTNPSATATLVKSTANHGEPVLVELLYANGTPKDTNTTTQFAGVRLRENSTSATTGITTVYVPWIYNGTNQPVLSLDGLGSEVVNPGTSYHAASLVSCMECHGGSPPNGHEVGALSDCSKCHYGGGTKGGQQMRNLWAGGFGLTSKANDTGIAEAHREFQGTNDTLTRFQYGSSNGACVACHTHVAVDITYIKPDKLKFDANFFPNGTEGLGYFSAEGFVKSNSSGP